MDNTFGETFKPINKGCEFCDQWSASSSCENYEKSNEIDS